MARQKLHEASTKKSNSPESEELISADSLAPLVAIGGLFVIKRFFPHYRKLLKTDADSAVNIRERFMPLPNRGIAPAEITLARLTDRLKRLQEESGGEKMYLAGHSLGGLLATMVAIEHPDLVAGVSALGGVHAGIKKHTIASNGLKIIAGNPKEAESLKEDSPFMREHIERIKYEWPEDTPLQVISTALDIVIKPPQGFGLELPNGRRPEEKIIVPAGPAGEFVTRRVLGIDIPEGVEVVPTFLIPDHVFLPQSPAVIEAIDAHRKGAVPALEITSTSARRSLTTPLIPKVAAA